MNDLPTPRTAAGPPTICKCGLAKSYHKGRFNPGHEYEPRYEPMAWREGYRTAQREAEAADLRVREGEGPAPAALDVCRRLVEWWDLYPEQRYDPVLGPIVTKARRLTDARLLAEKGER